MRIWIGFSHPFAAPGVHVLCTKRHIIRNTCCLPAPIAEITLLSQRGRPLPNYELLTVYGLLIRGHFRNRHAQSEMRFSRYYRRMERFSVFFCLLSLFHLEKYRYTTTIFNCYYHNFIKKIKKLTMGRYLIKLYCESICY